MRPEALVVDTHPGEVIDDGYAVALVAVRTGIPLTQVRIVAVEDMIPTESPAEGPATCGRGVLAPDPVEPAL